MVLGRLDSGFFQKDIEDEIHRNYCYSAYITNQVGGEPTAKQGRYRE